MRSSRQHQCCLVKNSQRTPRTVQAIKKITYSKPGEAIKVVFLDTTPGTSRTTAGVVLEAATGDSSRTS